MNLKLRVIEDREEAVALAPEIDAHAAAAMAEFRDKPLPPEVGKRFLERSFDRPETLLLVAEDTATGKRHGLCAVGPMPDPLTGEVTPVVVILFVDPALRHRGVARGLVREARRLLDKRGIPVLATRAGHNDDALISMGERWGFVRSWEFMVHE